MITEVQLLLLLPDAIIDDDLDVIARIRDSSDRHSVVGGVCCWADSVSTSELMEFPVILGSHLLLSLHSVVKYRCQIRRDRITSEWKYGIRSVGVEAPLSFLMHQLPFCRL